MDQKKGNNPRNRHAVGKEFVRYENSDIAGRLGHKHQHVWVTLTQKDSQPDPSKRVERWEVQEMSMS